MGKRAVMLLMAVMLLFGAPSVYASTQPEVVGKYAVSIDAKTGDVLFDKDAHHHAFPASTTKILTGLLLLEHTKPGEQIAFSQKALEEEKSNYQIEFQPGETVDRDTALMILMVLSANDMAYAIAEHISGSTEAFAKLMNEKAKQLGAKDSHFVTPNGLHKPDHYTTPYDMAMIGREARNHPELMNAMMTQRTTVTTSRQTVSIFNKAKFFNNPNCIGAKTGFTNESGNTLVEIDKKGDSEIVNVVMASHNPAIYNDMKVISEYVFPQFAKQNILNKNTWTNQISYLDKSVPVELENSYDMVLKQGEGKNVDAVFHPLQFEHKKLYEEGIKKGEVLGQVDLMKNGHLLYAVKTLAKEDVKFKKPITEEIVQKGSALPMFLIILGILLASGIGIAIKKRKQNYNIL
jgi:D-alanyl-D-alanine carboxypeptidase